MPAAKLNLSADTLAAISHVLEKLASGGISVEFETKTTRVQASWINKGRKVKIEISSLEIPYARVD